MDPKTTISRCTAFVQFDTRREAKDALKFMNGHVLPGAKKGLLVKFAEDHHRRVQRQEQGGGQVRKIPVWGWGGGSRRRLFKCGARAHVPVWACL